ncbi:MAG: hypothetical protein JJU20_11820 [Opitutales bacterium]|nr:hypothetical protein [Opitutales bacterium]
MTTIRNLLAIGSLAAFIGASALNAQPTPPEGTVDENGNLVINGQTISPPEGTVDGSGNLVIGDTTINRPDATVNADGSLTVGTETYSVPSLPISLFFSGTYVYADNDPAFEEAGYTGWSYNPVMNHYWDQADGWIYRLEFSGAASAWFYINSSIGTENEFWSYSIHFESWVWTKVGENPWLNPLANAEEDQIGLFYVSGDGWYWFRAFTENGDRVAQITNVIDSPEGSDWTTIHGSVD